VLHFIGHGTYDLETDEGVLAFLGQDGRADYVTASSLADLLNEAEPTPRLVVLNSCQSGASGSTDLFSGTAAALAHSGIRAVAAMQFSISDIAALAFARGFYTALAFGRGVDEAMRSGRIAILGIVRGTLEWVTPVLYLRGDEARLFDVVPSTAAPAAASERREADGPRARRSRRNLWLAIGGAAAVLVVGGVIAILALRPTGGDGDGDSAGGGSASTAELAVPLDSEWVNTGLYCYLGDEFVIEVTGRGWLDETAESQIGPEGLMAGQRPEARVLSDANTGSVIGRLDTTPEVFFVGEGTTYICPAQGALELGINDTDLEDNSGEFAAFVTLNQ
jgi:hypothetical protein